ncbi:MAG: hypothetical protein RSD45_00610 [Gordonibacter sp.]
MTRVVLHLRQHAGWHAGREERGTIAPLVVMSALLLLAVLAFAVDQGIACAVKVRQENALDAARDACMAPSFALVAKNEGNPGHVVACRFVQVLREEGVEGSVSVWFYEAPREDVPPSRRIWGIGVQVQEASPTIFSQGFGIASLPVASKRVVVAEPFADEVTWRPDLDSGNGRYEWDAAGTVEAPTFFGFVELSEFPDEVEDAVSTAVSAVTSGQKRKERA